MLTPLGFLITKTPCFLIQKSPKICSKTSQYWKWSNPRFTGILDLQNHKFLSNWRKTTITLLTCNTRLDGPITFWQQESYSVRMAFSRCKQQWGGTILVNALNLKSFVQKQLYRRHIIRPTRIVKGVPTEANPTAWRSAPWIKAK